MPAVVVVLTPLPPSALQQFRDLGVLYLDAPVSGGPEGAAKGTLSIMVGGEEKARQLLTCFSARIAVGFRDLRGFP